VPITLLYHGSEMQRTTERVGELERQLVITKDQKKKVFFLDTATQGWGGDAHRKRNLLFPKSTGFRSIRQCHLKVKYSTMYSATVPRAPAVAGYENPRAAGCGGTGTGTSTPSPPLDQIVRAPPSRTFGKYLPRHSHTGRDVSRNLS